jgi:hypothetical protein
VLAGWAAGALILLAVPAPMPAVRCLERVMTPVLPAGWRASGAGTLGAAPAPAAVTSPPRTRVAVWSREGSGLLDVP